MSSPAPQSQEDELDAILRDLHVQFLEIVGDEFAPKQDEGSPERKRLLGLTGQTTPLLIETRAALLQNRKAWLKSVLPEKKAAKAPYGILELEKAYQNGRSNVIDTILKNAEEQK